MSTSSPAAISDTSSPPQSLRKPKHQGSRYALAAIPEGQVGQHGALVLRAFISGGTRYKPGNVISKEVILSWPLGNRLAMGKEGTGVLQYYEGDAPRNLTSRMIGVAAREERAAAAQPISNARKGQLAKARAILAQRRAERAQAAATGQPIPPAPTAEELEVEALELEQAENDELLDTESTEGEDEPEPVPKE